MKILLCVVDPAMRSLADLGLFLLIPALLGCALGALLRWRRNS
jgi:hypothetical protein